MIDPKELRIGNLIVKHQTGRVDHVWKVGTSFLNDLTDFDYDPIPITPAWLERLEIKPVNSSKFPFPYDPELYLISNEYHLRCGRLLLWDAFTGHIDLMPFLVEIKFVHQLQNLYFALTGSELTITEKATT